MDHRAVHHLPVSYIRTCIHMTRMYMYIHVYTYTYTYSYITWSGIASRRSSFAAAAAPLSSGEPSVQKKTEYGGTILPPLELLALHSHTSAYVHQEPNIRRHCSSQSPSPRSTRQVKRGTTSRIPSELAPASIPVAKCCAPG